MLRMLPTASQRRPATASVQVLAITYPPEEPPCPTAIPTGSFGAYREGKAAFPDWPNPYADTGDLAAARVWSLGCQRSREDARGTLRHASTERWLGDVLSDIGRDTRLLDDN
jgi:hypothetical protein